MEKSIETALTRKDHLGRVLTPKEAFREISYAFHGKGPSQKTLEKRKRKMNEDFLATRSNLDQESQLDRLRAVQKVCVDIQKDMNENGGAHRSKEMRLSFCLALSSLERRCLPRKRKRLRNQRARVRLS